MTNVRVSLRFVRPDPLATLPDTIGGKLRRCRLTRGLLQTDVARLIGVREETVTKWENDYCEPPIPLMPAVIAFMGYDPYPAESGYAARLKAKRRAMGWTIKQAAESLDINEATWGMWERGATTPAGALRAAVDRLLSK
ncbi:helix-turn-helix domain-containing protein [Sinimarinibacterium flocculans]|uniref:helix-turn-helix domain-containing protein n=1 Tax=Sinimarinibacterium flocculans TaxID=985250 RepID=UPI003515C383